MKFTVEWSKNAEDRLIELWLKGRDRANVTAAARAIDEAVAFDPQAVGESRGDGLRIVFAAPLGAIFEAFPERGLVKVVSVWRIVPRRLR